MQYFFNPRSTYFTNTGRPASLGRLAFYESGTQTLKAVYDQDGVTPIANPVDLDTNGRSPAIKLADSDYKVVLESYLGQDGGGNPVYATEWTIDPYRATTGSGGSGNATNVLPDINTLINSDHAVVGDSVYVLGYYEAGDLGQGWFVWDDTSNAAEDLGSVFNVVGGGATGRWIRQFDSDVIYPQQWGAMASIPGGTVSSRLLSCFQYADTNNYQTKVIFPEQDYPIGGPLTLTGVDTIVEFKRGARITRSTPVTTSVTFEVKDIIVPIKNGGIVGTQVDLTITTGDLSDIPVSSWNRTVSDIQMLSKASGNYNGRLIIDDHYSIGSGGLSFTLNDIRFIKGSSIELGSGYSGQITINKFTYEDDLVNIFRDQTRKFLFEGVYTFQAQHFTNSPNSMDTTAYQLLLNTVTRGGNRIATIVWDFYSTYTISDNTIVTEEFPIEMEVGEDTTIDFTGVPFFGMVKNAPTRRIFRNQGGAPRLNDVIYPQWWGANTNQATANADRNVDGINDALASAIYSNNPIVDLNGATFRINARLNILVPNDATRVVTLQNGKFRIEDDPFPASSIISSTANCVIKDIEFDLSTVSASVRAFSITTNTMKLINCKIYNVKDNYVSRLSGGRVTKIDNCVFDNSTLGTTAELIMHEDPSFTSCTNSEFTAVTLNLRDPENILVTDCNFIDGQIHLEGTVAGTLCNKLHITDNKFTSDAIVSAYDNIGQTNIELLGGHGRCMVKDNSCFGVVNVKATELVYTTTHEKSLGSQALNIDYSSDLILHTNTGLLQPEFIKPVWSSIMLDNDTSTLTGTAPIQPTYRLESTHALAFFVYNPAAQSLQGDAVFRIKTCSNLGY